MDILTKTELEHLMHKEQQWCVSFYMPTHRAGVETQQDPIRLKNLLGEAEKRLSGKGFGPRDVQKMLEPASRLLITSDFWRHQSDGLAIFLSPDGAHIYRLPLNFEEFVMVDDRFYIKPLLPLITGDGQFYILALSQTDIRLLNGTRYGVSEVDTGELISSMKEAFSFDDHERGLQIHLTGSARGRAGNQLAVFHGHGGGSDEDVKDELLRYFHLVEDGLMEYLQGDQVPLVLAGLDYLLPIYKEANTYPNMLDMAIKGNADSLSIDELHKSAWEVIQPHFQVAQEKAFAFYQQLAGQESRRAADTLEKVLPAALHGRVETLFVAGGVKQWGRFNPVTAEIEIHDQREPGDDHLLDVAAVETYLNGGKVYIVEPGKSPAGNNIAAVLRY